MDLTRDSFVASALDDVQAGRTRCVTVADLIPDAPAAAREPRGDYAITDTFLALWESLSLPAHARTTALAVMRGIIIEPRHPAYRVTESGIPEVFQSQVGDAVTLVFSMGADGVVWLAVLHTH